ncbi:MAG: MFS transporter [Sulfolobaceae archaeon]|nr:MFS transporter [Sulfolobaceae archaeon]
MNSPQKKLPFIYAALILSLETITFRATNNMVLTTVPLLSKYDLHFSNTFVGFLAASLTTATLISTTFLNTSLNSKTRRLVFICASFFIPLSLLLYHFSTALTIWAIAIASGLAYGIITPNIVTSASIMSEDKRTIERLLGLYSTSLSLSLIIGPILETYLLNYVSYREIFLFFLPLAITEAILSLYIQFPTESIKVRINKLEELKNKGLIASILSITTYNVPFVAITTFLAIFARERFLTSASISYFSFIPFYVASFLTRFTMTLRPFRNLIKPMMVSVILTIAGLLGMVLSPSYALFIAFLIILGIPHGSVYPMSTIMISRYTKPVDRNIANSYFSSYVAILGIVVPPLVGAISSISDLQTAFLILIIPVVFSAILFFKTFSRDSILSGIAT